MAIFAPDISVCTRGSSAGAVASAAYMSRSRISCERDGRTFDYTRTHQREELVHDFGVTAPNRTSGILLERAGLWNEVERIEKRADAQLCRKIMIPLPEELTREQNIELAREIITDRVEQGHIIDACLHENRDGTNPHLHMLEPLREADERGFKPKSETTYLVRDASGNEAYLSARELKQEAAFGRGWEKVYLYTGGFRLTKAQAEERGLDPIKGRARKQPIQEARYLTNWNERERAEEWREQWASRMNQALEEAGHASRVDHRSYERQGVDRIPQVHEGPRVQGIERNAAQQAAMRGEAYEPVTDIRRENVAIARANSAVSALRSALGDVSRRIESLKSQIERIVASRDGIMRGLSSYIAGVASRGGVAIAPIGDLVSGLEVERPAVKRRIDVTGLRKQASTAPKSVDGDAKTHGGASVRREGQTRERVLTWKKLD